MVELTKKFDNYSPNHSQNIYSEETLVVQNRFKSVENDGELLNCLADFKTDNQKNHYGRASFKHFEELFWKTREIIAEDLTNDAAEEPASQRGKKIFTADDINAGMVESILYCGTPKTENGNLENAAESTLTKYFGDKRLSRARIRKISAEKTADRFDLITLNFFIFSKDKKYESEEYEANNIRYAEFIESTNKILDKCSMGQLYAANPYENFLLMCLKSDAPLPTFTEVWEKSFE